MTNFELLQAITEEAQELLDAATAGGDAERAFDLWADTGRLTSIHDELVQLGTAIRIETSNRQNAITVSF